jgi:K+ transporter
VPDSQRVEVREVCDRFYTAEARFGFMEIQSVGEVLPKALPFAWDGVVFMLPQPIATERAYFWSRVMQHMFLFLGRTGQSLVESLHIPPHQAVGVGLELEL